MNYMDSVSNFTTTKYLSFELIAIIMQPILVYYPLN